MAVRIGGKVFVPEWYPLPPEEEALPDGSIHMTIRFLRILLGPLPKEVEALPHCIVHEDWGDYPGEMPAELGRHQVPPELMERFSRFLEKAQLEKRKGSYGTQG